MPNRGIRGTLRLSLTTKDPTRMHAFPLDVHVSLSSEARQFPLKGLLPGPAVAGEGQRRQFVCVKRYTSAPGPAPGARCYSDNRTSNTQSPNTGWYPCRTNWHCTVRRDSCQDIPSHLCTYPEPAPQGCPWQARRPEASSKASFLTYSPPHPCSLSPAALNPALWPGLDPIPSALNSAQHFAARMAACRTAMYP